MDRTFVFKIPIVILQDYALRYWMRVRTIFTRRYHSATKPSLVEDLSQQDLYDVALGLLEGKELLGLANIANKTGVGRELLDLGLGAASVHQVNDVDVNAAQNLLQHISDTEHDAKQQTNCDTFLHWVTVSLGMTSSSTHRCWRRSSWVSRSRLAK